MSRLLAVDPSVNSSGVALFVDGALVAAYSVKCPPAARSDGTAGKALAIARAICSWALSHGPAPDELVVEWPVIRAAGKSPADPNDLPGLAGVAMAVAGMLDTIGSVRLTAYKPEEWAQLSKSRDPGEAWSSQRGARIASRLTPAELARVPAQHDAVDAVGLGLHHLGRLGRVRVYPRG